MIYNEANEYNYLKESFWKGCFSMGRDHQLQESQLTMCDSGFENEKYTQLNVIELFIVYYRT